MNATPARFGLALLLGVLLVAPTASAQVSAPASSPDTVISARLKYLSLQGPVAGVDILLASGKRLPVAAATDYISNACAYQGPARLTFARSLHPAGQVAAPDAVAKAAAAAPEVLATLDLPGGGDFLLLFSGDATRRLHVLAVPFSPTDVPSSSCLVWNITPRNLGLVLGGQRVLLASGHRQLVRPATGPAKNYFDLRIFDEHEGRLRPPYLHAQPAPRGPARRA